MNYKSCREFEFSAVDLYSLKPSALSEGLTFSTVAADKFNDAFLNWVYP